MPSWRRRASSVIGVVAWSLRYRAKVAADTDYGSRACRPIFATDVVDQPLCTAVRVCGVGVVAPGAAAQSTATPVPRGSRDRFGRAICWFRVCTARSA